jgi:predicted flap endonuclease-1-like 5' DNA nuclease
MTTFIKPETEAAIAARAYQFWEDEGRPDGRDEIHWQRALAELVPTTRPVVPNLRIVPTVSAKTVSATEDVSLIDGIGPKIAKELASVGVAKLSQIAAFTTDEMAKIDARLELKGRSAREEWIAQAKDLVAGAAPRAKVDQAKLAKKK